MEGQTDDRNLETFLHLLFSNSNGTITTEMAVRALAEYTGVSQLEASQVVDTCQLHHSAETMHIYVTRLMQNCREHSKEWHRMTVMDPAFENVSQTGTNTWKNDDYPSPTPVEPRRKPCKKICKQFIEKGICKYGSRCLFHHLNPLKEQQTTIHDVKEDFTTSQNIVDQCVKDIQSLKLSLSSAPMSSKGKSHEVLAALPSSDNNFCLQETSGKDYIKTILVQKPQPLQQESLDDSTIMPYAAFGNPGTALMVPLPLPGDELYGYVPLPLYIPPLL